MKKAYLISTGTELLLGSTIDTNSIFLSKKLTEMGIRVIGKSVIGDNEEHLTTAFTVGLNSADIVISSGGLGPTKDDLTKEVACRVINCKMEIVEEEVRRIEKYFASRQRSMAKSNIKQAMFPPGSNILKNSMGTAPGMYLEKENKILVLLPGPPREMENMYIHEVEPLFKQKFYMGIKRPVIRTIKVFGPGESQVEEMLTDVFKNADGCSLALLAIDGEIHIKVTAEGEDINSSQEKMDVITRRINRIINNNFIGYDDETLSSKIAEYLKNTGKTVAVAESCTGGLLAKIITDLPGSSNYFWGSVTSYSNDAKKVLLNVNENTIEQYGAVSEETASEMAKAVVNKFGVDFGLATTGLAGPDGGIEEKPVGLVYIALAGQDFCRVKEMRFVGDRNSIRMLSAKTALDLLRRHLISGGGNK